MTAIKALRKAAKSKALNKVKAESDIARCVEAYRSGYRDTGTTDTQRFLAQRIANRKTVAEGKSHMEKMRRHIAKLREEVVQLSHQDFRDTLYFAGSVYEDMKWADDKPGWETMSEDMNGLIRTLDHVDKRMQAVTSTRLSSSRRNNHVQRLTIDLANVYREHTGRKPASGGEGNETRRGSPFVLFVQAVLQQCAPREARRYALGQSVYVWLREDREIREILTYLDEHGG